MATDIRLRTIETKIPAPHGPPAVVALRAAVARGAIEHTGWGRCGPVRERAPR